MLTCDFDVSATSQGTSATLERKQQCIDLKFWNPDAKSRLMATVCKPNVFKLAAVRNNVETFGAADLFDFSAGVMATNYFF